MNKDSQQFIRVPFVHGINGFNVSSVGPNSCLLCSICVAYADVRVLLLCKGCALYNVWLLVCQTVLCRIVCMYCI
jgi:hypothetical protein